MGGNMTLAATARLTKLDHLSGGSFASDDLKTALPPAKGGRLSRDSDGDGPVNDFVFTKRR